MTCPPPPRRGTARTARPRPDPRGPRHAYECTRCSSCSTSSRLWLMPYGPPPRGTSSSKEPSRKSRDKEARPKPIRITVDLTPDDYQLLNRWLGLASVKLDQPISKIS